MWVNVKHFMSVGWTPLACKENSPRVHKCRIRIILAPPHLSDWTDTFPNGAGKNILLGKDWLRCRYVSVVENIRIRSSMWFRIRSVFKKNATLEIVFEKLRILHQEPLLSSPNSSALSAIRSVIILVINKLDWHSLRVRTILLSLVLLFFPNNALATVVYRRKQRKNQFSPFKLQFLTLK